MKKALGNALLSVLAVCFIPVIIYDRLKMAGSGTLKRWRDDGSYRIRY